MPNQLANLRISRVVIHQVFQRDDNRDIVEPHYNNELTILNNEGLQTLQERITAALGNDSYSVEMNFLNISTGSAFNIISEAILADDEIFISKSKQLALRLTEAQTSKRIPGGVVVIFSGTVGPASHPYVGVIKAEIHNGFYIKENNSLLIMQFLSDLLLTPQQKLYKIGLFIKNNLADNEKESSANFKVLVYDSNLRSGNLSDAATYFYSTFLGCTFTENGKKLTKDFYTHTKNFIDQLELNDEDKIDLNYALYSYLKLSVNNTISGSDFSEQYFSTDIQDRYTNYLRNQDFPLNSVHKDLTLLKRTLKKRKIKFSSDVRIEAPSNNFTDIIEIVGYNEGKTTLLISGKIKEQN